MHENCHKAIFILFILVTTISCGGGSSAGGILFGGFGKLIPTASFAIEPAPTG